MPVTADNMVQKANVQTAASFATKRYPAPRKSPFFRMGMQGCIKITTSFTYIFPDTVPACSSLPRCSPGNWHSKIGDTPLHSSQNRCRVPLQPSPPSVCRRRIDRSHYKIFCISQRKSKRVRPWHRTGCVGDWKEYFARARRKITIND